VIANGAIADARTRSLIIAVSPRSLHLGAVGFSLIRTMIRMMTSRRTA